MDYYYLNAQNQPVGPVPEADLQRLLATGAITFSTMVAAVGSDRWVPLSLALPGFAPRAASRADAFAITSFVLSLVGITLCCGLIIPSVLGVVFGHISLLRTKRDPLLSGRGLAIAGTIIGYLGIAVGVLSWILYWPIFMQEFHRAMEEARVNCPEILLLGMPG